MIMAIYCRSLIFKDALFNSKPYVFLSMIEHYATDDGSTSTDTWEKTKKELLDSLKVEMIDMTLVEFRINFHF